MLADQAFCDLVHAIGVASLCADDKQIWHLTKIYWYTVEFGVVREGDAVKAFGAGGQQSQGPAVGDSLIQNYHVALTVLQSVVCCRSAWISKALVCPPRGVPLSCVKIDELQISLYIVACILVHVLIIIICYPQACCPAMGSWSRWAAAKGTSWRPLTPTPSSQRCPTR